MSSSSSPLPPEAVRRAELGWTETRLSEIPERHAIGKLCNEVAGQASEANGPFSGSAASALLWSGGAAFRLVRHRLLRCRPERPQRGLALLFVNMAHQAGTAGDQRKSAQDLLRYATIA